jgi:trehalose 6-phosphate synthase
MDFTLMPRVVCVSNRLWAGRDAVQAGGLAVAISEVMSGSDGVWCGWSGRVRETATSAKCTLDPSGYSRLALGLSASEHHKFYLGYSNSVLWPVFHNRLDLARFEAGYFETYVSVNKRFASALRDHLRSDDVIWVHDFHFLMLASELRKRGICNRIGLFVHIPFPPAHVFSAIPEHRSIARALGEFDLIGLQSPSDVSHAISSLQHSGGARLLVSGDMRTINRSVRISSFPIGIDVECFGQKRAAENKPESRGRRRIIGIDRLDYTKGLPQKFRGFAQFLEQYPAHHKKVVLTQIAAPSRESVEAYADIRKELEGITGEINGRFGDLDWTPVQYIHRAAPRSRLAQIYRGSAVGLITSLADGMNLTAKEYVAAQDAADPGVLILSRFAGAAHQLKSALLINPYDADEMAHAINSALNMSLDARRRRHAVLNEIVQSTSAKSWAREFIAELAARRLPFPDQNVPAKNLRHVIDELRHGIVN